MLPVVGAIINLCFAIPAIRQILIQFNFYNVRLMAIIAVSITLVLLCLYFAIYGLTTRMYRKIVAQG